MEVWEDERLFDGDKRISEISHIRMELPTLSLEATFVVGCVCDLDEFTFGRCVRVRALGDNDVGLISTGGTFQASGFLSFDSILRLVAV